MEIDKVLKIILEKLNGIDYAFIGSTNLYVQGLEVSPRDIDILTTAEEIKKINKILKEYQTKEIYFDKSEGRNSFRSFYRISNIEIEVLGNVKNIYRKIESLEEKILVKFNGDILPCIPLSSELGTYKKMGRADKIEIIEKFLER